MTYGALDVHGEPLPAMNAEQWHKQLDELEAYQRAGGCSVRFALAKAFGYGAAWMEWLSEREQLEAERATEQDRAQP